MKHLTLHLTDRCNLSCLYCYQDRTGRGRLRWELIEKSVRLAFRELDPRLKISFYGGEPFLEWATIQRTVALVRTLQRRKYKEVCFAFTTNGLLLDDAKLQFLNSISANILLSLDGDRQSHDAGRGSGTFGELEAVLERLRSYHGINLHINSVIHPWNVQYLGQAVRFLSKLGLYCEYVLDALHPWTQQQLKLLGQQFRSLYRWCSEEIAAGRPIPFPSFTHGSFGRPYRCRGVRDSWVITPEGKIFDCVMRTPKWTFGRQEEFDRFLLGDLNEDLKRLPTEDAVAKIDHFPQTVDQSHRSSGPFRCSECRYVNRCAICPSVCLQATGDFLEVPRAHCIFTKLCCFFSDRLEQIEADLKSEGVTNVCPKPVSAKKQV